MEIILLQILKGIVFLMVSFFCFTPVGFVVLEKLKLNSEDSIKNYLVSTVLGLVLFTLAAYFFAFINLRFLIWIFPISGLIFFLKFRKQINYEFKISQKLLFTAVLVLGIIGQVAVNAPSGFPYKDGIYFWSSHGHDGVWHLALMEEMKKGHFPFQNPELAGEKLQNYHFFVDLLMSEVSRLFNFSSMDIYFRFMPTLFSVLLGLSAFVFVREWRRSEIAGIWAMIFTYFAGSFGYLLYIPTHGSLGGESIFWVSQTHSVLGNPPHASAFIILTVILFYLLEYFKKYELKYFSPIILLGGSIIEFKVYGGILLLFGLLAVGIYELIFKKIIKTLILFFSTLLLSFGIYFPNSTNSQDFLIWQPWWYIRTTVVATDRLNWLDLELRRQTYVAEGNWKRVIQLEVTAFLIFLFGNLGMRFLGFLTIFKQFKENIFRDSFNLFFFVITLVSFLIPVFFLQKGVAWNSIQFNQYFLLFFGFLAAYAMVDILTLLKKRFLKILVSLIIVLIAIPTQLGLLMQFYSNNALSKISYSELEALDYLKENSSENSIVLTPPFNKYEKDKYKNPPIPIYAWYDTGYVSAFSRGRTLISDEEQINIMGYDVKSLVKDREMAFQSEDYEEMNEFLRKYDVDYIYLAWDQKFSTGNAKIDADLIFENQDARIFKVRK